MLIKNGTIIDGTGKPRYKADLRVEQDKIKEIGKLTLKKKELAVNAEGKFVAPGFIDIINRSDTHFSLFESGGSRSLLKQGVTTVLGGSCGTSLAPIINTDSIRPIQKWENISKINMNWSGTKEFLDEIERHKPSINFATLTGHATLRRGLLGDNFGEMNSENLKKIEYLLAQALDEGSFGFSLGLAYSHERIASESELERVIKVLKKKKGLLAIHLRDEGKNLLEAVNEVIDIGRKYKISVHIYHLKAFGREAWGLFPKALETIEGAKDEGVKISFDVYPYSTTATVLYLLLPAWATEGGKAKVLGRLRDKAIREKIREALSEKEADLEDIVIARGNISHIFIGKTLRKIAQNQEISVSEALINMILAAEDQLIGFLPFLNDKNVESAVVSKVGMIASDSSGARIFEKNSGMLIHPRTFGAFPKFLHKFAQEKNTLSWEAAIHKITLMPAEKIGLTKRGRIEKGYFADIVIFDPQEIQDQATFQDPFQYAEGIDWVMVNGGFAVKRGKFQKNRYGRALRK